MSRELLNWSLWDRQPEKEIHLQDLIGGSCSDLVFKTCVRSDLSEFGRLMKRKVNTCRSFLQQH